MLANGSLLFELPRLSNGLFGFLFWPNAEPNGSGLDYELPNGSGLEVLVLPPIMSANGSKLLLGRFGFLFAVRLMPVDFFGYVVLLPNGSLVDMIGSSLSQPPNGSLLGVFVFDGFELPRSIWLPKALPKGSESTGFGLDAAGLELLMPLKISFDNDAVENGSEFTPNGSFDFDSVAATEDVGSPLKKPKSLSLTSAFEPTPLKISELPVEVAPAPAGSPGNLYFSI